MVVCIPQWLHKLPDTYVASLQCHSGATSSRQAEELQRKVLAGHEAQLGASHPETLIILNVLAIILQSQGKLEEARPRSGAERWPSPWKFQGEGAFFEVNESGRVDPSMSPIWASPKFRPNSVVELPGHEIHTCNVHQGWCQGSVLQFKTGESTLGADQPLAFSRNLKLWNLSGKLRKVQTPFNFQRVASLQDSEESLGFVRQKRTVRLVTSHWETQQHSDDERCQYCTNLAQFNTRPGFLCFQNQSAKAVCKTLLHDTNTSLID